MRKRNQKKIKRKRRKKRKNKKLSKRSKYRHQLPKRKSKKHPQAKSDIYYIIIVNKEFYIITSLFLLKNYATVIV